MIKVGVENDGRDNSHQPKPHEGKDGDLGGHPAAEATPLVAGAGGRGNPDQTRDGCAAHDQNAQVERPAEQSIVETPVLEETIRKAGEGLHRMGVGDVCGNQAGDEAVRPGEDVPWERQPLDERVPVL